MSNAELSRNQQRFVELMQRICFGRIENLIVQSGEPVLDPLPRIVREYKFGSGDGPRPSPSSNNFTLKSEVVELFATFAKLTAGQIEAIEIRHGLPFRLIVADGLDELEAT